LSQALDIPDWKKCRALLWQIFAIWSSAPSLSMLPISFPHKRAALLGAFFNRFAIGFVIILIDIPCSGWLIGLTIGILLSLPPAIVTKVFVPILGIGAVGGVIIGLIREKFAG
jgi:hypothetical protein